MPGSRVTRSAGSWPTGSSAGVPPDVLRSGLDLLAGDRPHELGVVVDLQRAEALGAGVLGDQAEGGAAVAAHQAAGGTRGDRGHRRTSRPGRIRERSESCDDYLLIFPAPGRRAARDGIGTFRSRACAGGGCRGFIGPCPSAPLDEWNAVDCTQSAPARPPLVRMWDVTTRIVYTDLDGTMVGPRGSFWHTAGPGADRRPRRPRCSSCTAPGSRWCWSAAGPSSR